jgi:tRNA U34 2-thiouridine synthase MnmA/TrmU
MNVSRPVRALGMLSGGLDSSLATSLLQQQGIEVVGVNFSTGFCRADHQRQVHRKGTDPKKLRNEALRAGADFGFEVHIIDIATEYLEVLRHPRHGYGKNANPCIDCRVLMMSRAREFMAEIECDFIFTGEVLGQRPKSQTRKAMNIVAEESGLLDRLLRPLSAKLLAPTRVEREGLVDRDRLLGLSGRDRNPQLKLAEEWGLIDMPQPAGGCCSLTDAGYSNRVFDLFAHGRREDIDHEDLLLCKAGRHFRISEHAKVVVARYEEENAFLDNFVGSRFHLCAVDYTGPVAVLDLNPGTGAADELLEVAARITARYGKGKREPRVRVRVRHAGDERLLDVVPATPAECEAWVLR